MDKTVIVLREDDQTRASRLATVRVGRYAARRRERSRARPLTGLRDARRHARDRSSHSSERAPGAMCHFAEDLAPPARAAMAREGEGKEGARALVDGARALERARERDNEKSRRIARSTSVTTIKGGVDVEAMTCDGESRARWRRSGARERSKSEEGSRGVGEGDGAGRRGRRVDDNKPIHAKYEDLEMMIFGTHNMITDSHECCAEGIGDSMTRSRAPPRIGYLCHDGLLDNMDQHGCSALEAIARTLKND